MGRRDVRAETEGTLTPSDEEFEDLAEQWLQPIDELGGLTALDALSIPTGPGDARRFMVPNTPRLHPQDLLPLQTSWSHQA